MYYSLAAKCTPFNKLDYSRAAFIGIVAREYIGTFS